MKYPTLAAALSLVLGSGVAIADTQTSQTAPATSTAQPVELFFDTASAELESDADVELKEIAKWSRCNPKGAIILEGHADPRGEDNDNVVLSARRAAAVQAKLISMGVRPNKIVLTLYGEAGPRRDNFAEDRRVTARATTDPRQEASLLPMEKDAG